MIKNVETLKYIEYKFHSLALIKLEYSRTQHFYFFAIQTKSDGS